MLAWIMEHQAVLAVLALAILDFVFAVSPSFKSNGVIHWLYLFLGGKATPPAQIK